MRGVWGGSKVPASFGKKNPLKNRGYPFLTVFDKFLTKNGVNLGHWLGIICDKVPHLCHQTHIGAPPRPNLHQTRHR